MHPEAMRGVEWAVESAGLRSRHNPDYAFHKCGTGRSYKGLDVGGAYINGSARRLVGTLTGRVIHWTGLDIEPGLGVDIVADARKPVPDDQRGKFDFVLCTEVFEHVCDWSSIVASIFEWLRPGGTAFMTCASTGREPHGRRGDPVEPGEWYRNVKPGQLVAVLSTVGFSSFETMYQDKPGDVYAWAKKGN